MIDRFGLLPQATKNLFAVAEIRLLCRNLGITRLDFGPAGGRIEFADDASADPEALIGLVQRRSSAFRMDGPQKLRILMQEEQAETRFEQATRLLDELAPD